MIQKYKLKKELPGFPVGSIFEKLKNSYNYTCTNTEGITETIVLSSLEKYKDWYEPVIEFVKGRWYKLSPETTNDLRYIKFDRIESKRSYNCVHYTESIRDRLGYSKKADYIVNTIMEKGLILVEDSEVTSYLKSKLTFGGKEVTIVKGKYESTTMINCADFSCTLLHLKVLYDSIWELTNWNVENDKFKVKEIDGIKLPFETITIGCQTDTIDKLKEIIDTATKLMK